MSASKAKAQALFKDLEEVVEKLSPDNAVMALKSFTQITQLLVHRQRRLGKTVLKRKMVMQAWELLSHHHEKCFGFKCEGPLAEKLGNISEDEAVSFYGTQVVGTVQDVLGQKISIGDGALVHMYKDAEENHTMESQYFQPTRGKRLPWIRHVLTRTESIYLTEPLPNGERRLIYTARAIIPHSGGETVTYFVVIVRRDRNGNLHFLTAYPVFEEVEFLKVIEKTDPYVDKRK
jgi:hypothetical protein